MTSSSPTAFEIHVLDLGTIEADASEVVLGRAPGSRQRVPTFGHLLLGGEQPVLVDSGFAAPDVLARLGMAGFKTPEQALERQLGAHGVQIDDIGMLINTHLHLDHCGQNHRFELKTPIVINRRELEYSVSGLEGPIYAPEDTKHMVDRLHAPGSLQLLDLDLTGPIEIIPGVTCMQAGGHTPGALMVLVETREGIACICGDLIYNIHDQVIEPLGQVGRDEPAPVGVTAMSRRAELAAIKRALRLGSFLLPMHDRPARTHRGRVTGRLTNVVPGPVLPLETDSA
jgi:glyoxylase-like metal-dependent hydrolase (beta-lactamase superfamily II)